MRKTVVVLGASPDETRYSHKAVRKLKQNGFDVVAIGAREGQIEDVPIQTEKVVPASVYAVTLYLNPALQKQYYDYILGLNPAFIFYNYGTENDELKNLAQAKGIENREGCTLIELSLGRF
ncbi:MAG: hypothetical protein BWY70_00149 [Bacteroidetes bacterium ADurb.Bin408]|nr:MAG: hypothetical protein BWY70_00149 [Bacteroidetes bacterium ADurb.Bin408]